MAETFYLTKKGFERIQKERQALLDFKMSKMKGEVPTMLRSEEVEPEYLVYQEDMSLLEARLAEYDTIIKNAKIIETPPKDQRHVITLGATIICEVSGKEDEFTILGSLESNPAAGRISNESPVGKAFMGRQVGEVVEVNSAVKVVYKILKITY
ncbi:MAG: GreA/GreB family elongation factor [Candidatus Wildermuthbacteria bacterium]|nr:GreA/GreB family elongation factor [Candidatus Wildermuthbacteria bacterium]